MKKLLSILIIITFVVTLAFTSVAPLVPVQAAAELPNPWEVFDVLSRTAEYQLATVTNPSVDVMAETGLCLRLRERD